MDGLSNSEVAGIMRQRQTTYALLARLFREEIGGDFLEELRGMRFPADTGNPDADEGYRLIATYLSNAWEDTCDELAIDYVRTFIGNGIDAYSAAYPHESVYSDPKRLTMADARDEVLAIYRSCGMEKSDGWKDGEDHVSVELEFMSALADLTASALDGGDGDGAMRLVRTQRGFLEEHLGAWAGMFASDMRKFARTDFYKGLSSLFVGFIADDLTLLSEMAA